MYLHVMWWRHFTQVLQRTCRSRARCELSPRQTACVRWGDGAGQRRAWPAICVLDKTTKEGYSNLCKSHQRAWKMPSDGVAAGAPEGSWTSRRHGQGGKGPARSSQRRWLTQDPCGGEAAAFHSSNPFPGSCEELPSSHLNLTRSPFTFHIFSCPRGLQQARSPPAPSIGCPVSLFSTRKRVPSGWVGNPQKHGFVSLLEAFF